VLILEGYLGAHYGRQHVLALSASLAFEQSYEGVEGDSASAAELIALLSAIADVPLRQDIAITGSVNQHGQLQAIGGVNEKIEGFYAVCARAGLTGTQGVIIPPSNARHLMLRREVVAAVAAGRFHVWTCATIDNAIGLLTGMEPGSVRADGSYPEGTFNRTVMSRLADFAHTVAQAARESTAAALNSSRDS
jgi:predicted ATP-dependent protease